MRRESLFGGIEQRQFESELPSDLVWTRLIVTLTNAFTCAQPQLGCRPVLTREEIDFLCHSQLQMQIRPVQPNYHKSANAQVIKTKKFAELYVLL